MPSKINERSPTLRQTVMWCTGLPEISIPLPKSYTKEEEMTADFSIAKLDVKNSGAIIFKSLRENHLSFVILYPAKYQSNVKVKIISDTWGLKFTSYASFLRLFLENDL